jgi:predicted ATP-grasp superfamily ATP-dependent carboligase
MQEEIFIVVWNIMVSMITIVYGSILPPTSIYQRKKSES